MIISAFALALSLSQLGSTGFDAARVETARANYEAIMSGRKHVGQFNRQELADILAIADALDSRRQQGTRSERCVADETKRAGGTPSALEQRVIDIKCREPGESLK